MGTRKVWYRDVYAEAVWSSEALSQCEKLVALAYADHAGKGDGSKVWVTWARLSERTGIRSQTTLNRALRGLIATGWLVEVEGRRQHRSPRYRLVIPANPEVRHTYVWDGRAEDPDLQKMEN
jgi:hypothetical protein